MSTTVVGTGSAFKGRKSRQAWVNSCFLQVGVFCFNTAFGVRYFVQMRKKGPKSIQVSRELNEAFDGHVEAKQAAAKLVIADLNLSLKFANVALDLYEAGNREEAKAAKAAARK